MMMPTTAQCGENLGAMLKRAARRARTALQAAFNTSGAPDFTRIESYANGERDLELYVYTTDEQHWHSRLTRIEAALERALTTIDPHAPRPNGLRRSSGYGQRLRFQRWRIPAPYGPRVLVALGEILAITHDLGIGEDTHVTSNSTWKER